MLLSKLFSGAPDMEIRQLSVDSRMPMEDAIFFCLNGIKYDGHDYIEEAVKNGAKVIIYSKEIERKEKAIYIKVADVNNTLKKTAKIFYGDPGKDIDEFVVGGNYGRCSVALFINHFLNKKEKCGYVGILGIRYDRTE
ncbi:MAG: UDP-N-acetylmuramoyl-L-alanyl-D-glutamate--2,6-diaminopimelate ligase, partial [Erysipelotrichaceae bacterium]|nr:UDP-N-acetylmuramoyl-L-alanyl-D-glutamate--2,6-diaminopimelate ligase [Erysipelotrichaceae bacterium]